MRRRRKLQRLVSAGGGSLRASCFHRIFWVRAADRVLGPAAHNPRALQGAPHRLSRDPQPGLFRQVTDQTRRCPSRDRQAQTPRPSAYGGQQGGPLGFSHLRGASRAWRILHPCKAPGPVAFEPAQPRGLALADEGGDLRDLEPSFG
jgi:hypothetical protein